MVLSLVLSSCGEATTEEEEEDEEELIQGPIPVFEEPEQSFAVGETAQSTMTKVTVLELTVTESYEYDDPVSKGKATKEAKPGMTFLIITLEIENIGSITRQEGRARTRLMNPEGILYQNKPYLGENGIKSWIPLDPHRILQGRLLFEVPQGATDLKFQYHMVGYPEIVEEDEVKWAEWQIE